MKTVIVTEGETDRSLLLSILGSVMDTNGIEIITGYGKSSAVSLARSLLSNRENRVGLVLDADTVDERSVADEKATLDDLMGTIAPSTRYGIFLAVPELEGTLFTDNATAERLFGHPLTAEDKAEARFEPRRTIGKILKPSEGMPASVGELLLRAGQDSLRRLADHGVVKEVRDFIENTSQRLA